MKTHKPISAIVFLFILLSLPPAYAGKYALVIGNGSYKAVPALDTPVNDANAMAETLQNLGFYVEKGTDMSQEEMETVIRSFRNRLGSGDTALFYYSGHGVEVDGINYLVPVEIAPDMIRYKGVPVNVVLDKMEEAQTQVNIIILDACRSSLKGGKGFGKGLAAMRGGEGTYIAYATAPGMEAYTGTGSTSIFTKHLVNYIETPQLKIEDIFKRVRKAVMDETEKVQKPWDSSMLIGDVYLADSGGATIPEIDEEQVKKKITNTIGQEFVYIEPGTFMMGSPENEPGRDSDEIQHKVTLTKGFYMQTTEVTQGQWKAVMGNNPSSFKDCGDDCPVENVSWEDAQEFIKKLSRKEGKEYRLPTEAEWEYAARAGTTTPFHTGRCLSTDQANYDGNYPPEGCAEGKYREKTVPAGSFSPNAYGLYDMHGNVWEWCQDWYGDYPAGSVTNPEGSSTGSYRVFRGGGWYRYAVNCRSAYRGYDSPGYRSSDLGFRLALSPQVSDRQAGEGAADCGVRSAAERNVVRSSQTCLRYAVFFA